MKSKLLREKYLFLKPMIFIICGQLISLLDSVCDIVLSSLGAESRWEPPLVCEVW